MAAARFLVMIAVMLVAGFFGTRWLMTPQPLQPDARIPTFRHIDATSLPRTYDQTHASDDDPVRDRLRKEVLDYAKALGDDPCNQVLKHSYIKAVVAYARAWISIAPCLGSQTCGGSDSSRLDRGRQAFGSPLDIRVREAMQSTHVKASFGVADFPKDTTHLIADLAADPSINDASSTRQFRRVQAQLDVTPAHQDCRH
jgi:hypothetical protein